MAGPALWPCLLAPFKHKCGGLTLASFPFSDLGSCDGGQQQLWYESLQPGTIHSSSTVKRKINQLFIIFIPFFLIQKYDAIRTEMQKSCQLFFLVALRHSWLEDGAPFSKYGSLKANRSIVSKCNKSHCSLVSEADTGINFIHLTKRGHGND